MEENKSQKGFSIASMVLGIVSCSCILLVFSGFMTVIGIATGIVGLTLGIMARKQGATDNMAKAGVILSIVGLAVNVLIVVAFAGCVACTYCAALM